MLTMLFSLDGLANQLTHFVIVKIGPTAKKLEDVQSEKIRIFQTFNYKIIRVLLLKWAYAQRDNYRIGASEYTPAVCSPRCMPRWHQRPPPAGDYRYKKREIEKCHRSVRSRPPSTRWQSNFCPKTVANELQAAPVVRITPDLHQRSRKKSLHTFRQNFLVAHFQLPSIFFQSGPFSGMPLTALF